MAILKPGFTPGFRGRSKAPTLDRRAHYLASEHDRDSARLLGMEGQMLTPAQAIEAMGGPKAPYHEVIVAPSDAECRTIRARNPEHPQQAIEEGGHRLAKAQAQGRPYLLAIHEQDGRFHYHIAVAGPMPDRILGRNGALQLHWDRELFGDEPRIRDWDAHQRFKEDRSRLLKVIQEQKENERQRRDAVKRSAPGQKAEAARPFERRARDLVERRYQAEVAALQSRYEARGTVGSPRHLAELEQAGHRRTGALRRLEGRETAREVGAAKAGLGRVVGSGGRALQQTSRAAGGVTRAALDGTLRELGVPLPARTAARAALAMVQEAAQVGLAVGQEAAKAAVRSSVHISQASVKLGAGLVLALPTGGASLEAAGKELAQDLAMAGKELGHGALRAGAEVGQGAARTLVAGGQEFLPREVRVAAQMGATVARTGVGLAGDLLTLSPIGAARTLAGGGSNLAKTALRVAGAPAGLPEPLRRAFQVAGWVPVLGIAAKAAQLAAETAQVVVTATSRGLEVDR